MRIGLVTINAAQFNSALDKKFAQINERVNRVYRGYCVIAFNHLVNNTPQWSGSAAASWNFSLGAPDLTPDRLMAESYESWKRPGVFEPRFDAHDVPAIARAKERNQGRDAQVRLGVDVFISNGSRGVSNEAYASMLENNPGGYLRPENEGGQMILKTRGMLGGSYGTITKAGAHKLRSVRLGA